MIKDFSLVPADYKEKDPRALAYLYPTTLNIVAYAKQMQKFSFYQSLEIVEDVANNLGYILLPYDCLHWQRRQKFGAERKVKIGRKSFFLLRKSELTKTEKSKLYKHLSAVKKMALEGAE